MPKTRSRSLAIGRLDGAKPIVLIKPSEVGVLLEALRLAAQEAHEGGGGGEGVLRRIHDRIADMADTSPMEDFE